MASEPTYSSERVLGESKCKYFLYRTVGSSDESLESGYKVSVVTIVLTTDH